MGVERVVLLLVCEVVLVCCLDKPNHKHQDDIYLNFEYDVPNNSLSDTNSDFIIPNPDDIDRKEEKIDVLPKVVVLPDDSLADTDLKDHDFIDSIMYIYYGTSKKTIKTRGSDLIIVGSILNCMTQIIVIAFVFWKRYYKGKKKMLKYLVAASFSNLFLTNLIFMFGVYATKSHTKCLTLAILHDFFHTCTGLWLFFYIFYIYRHLTYKRSPIFKLINMHLTILGLPTFFIYWSYVFHDEVYETKKYCFNTFYSPLIEVYSIRHIAVMALSLLYTIMSQMRVNWEVERADMLARMDENYLQTRYRSDGREQNEHQEIMGYLDAKAAVDAAWNVQFISNLNWFCTLLALHTVEDSNLAPFLHMVSTNALSYYIFFKKKVFFPVLDLTDSLLDVYATTPMPQKKSESSQSPNTSMEASSVTPDQVPLLNQENGTELKEFKTNVEVVVCKNDFNISTISA